MSVEMETTLQTSSQEAEFVTFYVSNMLMAVYIRQVEEINRHVEVTAVPHAPDCVKGVINLRGAVVTVIDLRRVLGMAPIEASKKTRTVVVRSNDEQIGLLVDRIADVVKVADHQIDATPANIGGVDGRFFQGVKTLETELLIILDIDTLLATEPSRR